MASGITPPPTKRQKTKAIPDMDFEVEIVPQIIKHTPLYFPDGNIILSVVNDHELHLFRCHKSVLAKHSSVFSDIFKLAQEGSESEEYEGVPNVTLSDPFEDVDALLTLLYDPLKMPYKKHDLDTATTLHGPLRLATKYQMDSLRSRFISILQADWPASLHDWDDNEAEIAKKLQDSSCEEQPPFPEPAKVISLAKECNVRSLLSAAFYQLGRSIDVDQNPVDFAYNEADTKLLSTDDWSCLIRGRDRLRIAVTRFLHQFLTIRRTVGTVNSICNGAPIDRPDSWGCRKCIKDWWIANCFETLTTEDILFIDPLEGLKKLSNMVSTAQTICKPCREWVQKELADQRERVWDDIYYCFDLSSDGCMVDSSSDV